MKNKAHEIVIELDKKLNINVNSEEEMIDYILKIKNENNIPSDVISKYLTNHLIENIIHFNGNEQEMFNLINKIIEE